MHRRLWVMGILSIGIVLVASIVSPIPQSMAYHQFADQRTYWGVQNFFNVVSNLAFLPGGVAGVIFIGRSLQSPAHSVFITRSEHWPYLIFFLSVVMACFGSAYYHWTPDNDRLLWDRLPIAIALMALLAATLSERVSLKLGPRLMPLFILLGVGSVLYWYWSEQMGVGNLNFYIVVQFYSLLLIVLLSLFFPSRYHRGADIYVALILYAIAKLAEIMDQEIYDLTQIISGHTLKHLLVALTICWILRMLRKREPLPEKLSGLSNPDILSNSA